ncbi:unnamed protein product [Paramecium sonneborni]|uniref:Uncharacterized protein n=1 Tax=Paramecium sonneborni TaxID=65129 RepID=A0A8S1RKW5_9CILI|nr:unnamed protein product [Paramecium sonneborni]
MKTLSISYFLIQKRLSLTYENKSMAPIMKINFHFQHWKKEINMDHFFQLIQFKLDYLAVLETATA